MGEPDLSELHLDVYDTRDGTWNPDHGEVTIPEGWEFLPSGDTFLTRQVKAMGVYWLSWRPRGRNRPHRRRLGLWAPAEAIAQARSTAERSAAERAHGREQGARQRSRAEDRYRQQLAAAIIEYLAFAPAYQELAETIAREAAGRAAAVGSSRVGRTRLLPLPERATLAARAWIRHRHTDYEHQLDAAYEQQLDTAPGEDFLADELGYRAVKSRANDLVDEFIAAHRDPHR